ncbi:hypothetical protein AOLI_G00262090 [Acnodon oligacanthus]
MNTRNQISPTGVPPGNVKLQAVSKSAAAVHGEAQPSAKRSVQPGNHNHSSFTTSEPRAAAKPSWRCLNSESLQYYCVCEEIQRKAVSSAPQN